MTWEYIKDKVLVFGDEDYVFIEMITSIVNEFDKVVDEESTKIYTFLLLKELIIENLIDVYEVKENSVKEIPYEMDKGIDHIVCVVNKHLKFPLISSSFCITTNKKGVDYIANNDNKGW